MEPITMLDDRGIARAIRMDPEKLAALGLQFNSRVRTPKGCGSVIGLHGKSLYILLDTNCSRQEVTGFLLEDIAEDPTMIQLIEECAPAATRGVEHRVKQVIFSCQCRSVVMQGRNGPCPVLALANALLLAGRLRLKQAHPNRISAAELQNALAAYLWTKPALPAFLHACSTAVATASSDDTSFRTIASIVRDGARLEKLRAALLGEYPDEGKAQEVLARMYEGLDIDPIFADEESFVGDNAVLLFALAGVRLLHGWVVPPDSPYAPLRRLSFNQLTDLVASVSSPVGAAAETPPERPAEDLQRQKMAAAFYEATSVHQMTDAGLRALEGAVGEREVAVLFRRNHFFTLTKLDGKLLALCSDENFADKSTFVFSRLDSITEDGNFTDGDGVDTDPLLSYIQACTGSEFSEESIQLCRAKLQAQAVAGGRPIESVTHEQVLQRLRQTKEATPRRLSAEETGGNAPAPTAANGVDDVMEALEEKVKQFCDVFPGVEEEVAMNQILSCRGSLERAVQAQLEKR